MHPLLGEELVERVKKEIGFRLGVERKRRQERAGKNISDFFGEDRIKY